MRRTPGVLLALTAMLACAPGAAAGEWDVDISSTEIEAPFASEALVGSLAALREHRIALATAVPAPDDALDRSADALRAGLTTSPGELEGATLLALGVFVERGDATAAMATAAVASMLAPAISDELWLAHAEATLRAGLLPSGPALAGLEPLASLEPSRVAVVRAATAHRRGDTALAAETLTAGLTRLDGEATDALCALGGPILASAAATEAAPGLAVALAVGCAGESTAVGPSLARTVLGRVLVGWRRPLSPAERLRAARRLYERVQHDAVLAAVAPLLDDAAIDTEARCEALWRAAMTYRRSRRASSSRAPYTRMVEVCGSASAWYERALYGLAWNDFREGASDASRTNLQQLLEHDPTSRYADDAIFYLVRIAADAGDLDAAHAAVEPLFDGTVALGDLGGDALWHWLEMHDGQDHRDALDRAVSVLAGDTSYFSQGRAAYVRALDAADAPAALLDVAERFPLTFYAYLAVSALERMAADERAGAAEALSSWREDVALARTAPVALVFAPLPEDDAVRRARAWFAGGQAGQGARALERSPLDDDATTWVTALGYHLEGTYTRSHDLARRELDGWQSMMPDPTNRLLWEIAYPRPYPEVVAAAADESRIPASMIWAIMREESAFRPRVESYAHAFGLMQLLESNGSSHAKRDLGIEGVDADELREPVLNIRVGAAFLGHLATRLAPHTVLMAAGYNAGRGAVNKWLAARGSVPLHTFVEAIPYEQTRNYSKRVNSSVFIYETLYGTGDVPPLRLDDLTGGDREALDR